MKFYKRFLSAFLCCALSLGAFSFTASAEEVDSSNFKLHYYAFENVNYQGAQININNGTTDSIQRDLGAVTNGDISFSHRLTFTDLNSQVMFKADRNYKFTVNNLYFQVAFIGAIENGELAYTEPDTDISFQLTNCYITYLDGGTQAIRPTYTYNPRNGTYSLSIEFTPEQDTTRLMVQFKHTDNVRSLLGSSAVLQSINLSIGTLDSTPYELDITVQSEEAGLLSGLLGKITELWETTKEGFSSLVNGIKDVFNSIIELPGKLWNLIEEGLKNLFVPDSAYMANYSDRWDQLLSSRLGAVYEVGEIVSESWDGIMQADQSNQVEIPIASINLPGGETFEFGGYFVDCVPEGFDVLVTALKTIVGIVCTCAFINGLIKRYDEVMGVEK